MFKNVLIQSFEHGKVQKRETTLVPNMTSNLWSLTWQARSLPLDHHPTPTTGEKLTTGPSPNPHIRLYSFHIFHNGIVTYSHSIKLMLLFCTVIISIQPKTVLKCCLCFLLILHLKPCGMSCIRTYMCYKITEFLIILYQVAYLIHILRINVKVFQKLIYYLLIHLWKNKYIEVKIEELCLQYNCFVFKYGMLFKFDLCFSIQMGNSKGIYFILFKVEVILKFIAHILKSSALFDIPTKDLIHKVVYSNRSSSFFCINSAYFLALSKTPKNQIW